ncbi:MAG: hypothetical protein ATN35_09705 [Epulopiscium sp. Nele67-Bin004]|nr:MAG: hypothetical protein ATN35_09705 [Epulopiscium sp. Nele67-Bin004]
MKKSYSIPKLGSLERTTAGVVPLAAMAGSVAGYAVGKAVKQAFEARPTNEVYNSLKKVEGIYA